MNVKEMHIQVEQGTQQVAANRARRFLPEEIDLVLNKIQDRFILSCLRPREDGSGGFELDQAKAGFIRALVTNTRTPLPAYIDTDERYKVHLPSNYRHLLADWSYTTDLCGAAMPAASSITQYITRLEFPVSTNSGAPYYEDITLQMPDVAVTIPDDLAPGNEYEGYQELQDKQWITPWILWKANILYWEKFDGFYYPANFIAVKTSAYVGAVAIDVDGDVNTDEVVVTRSLQYHAGSGTRHNNRLVSSDKIPSLNESRFWKSSHFSPISELEGENLIIHRANSFIVTGVGLSYIRNPRPISLSLDSDCELAGTDTHQIICDLAIEYIKNTAQNVEGTQLKQADIAQRVTL